MNQMNIRVYENIMGANEAWAAKTKEFLKEKRIAMFNFIGSPGCGKTALLETLARYHQVKMAVLEGDLETTYDAERLHQWNIPVFQLLTKGGCHLEAKMVYEALKDLPLEGSPLVIVENVGNLVCPAEFDLGENGKIAFLSITEGEDKPAKYPYLFREAKACVITKLDLLPHLNFNLDRLLSFIKEVNVSLPVFQTSSLQNKGVKEFLNWLKNYQ